MLQNNAKVTLQMWAEVNFSIYILNQLVKQLYQKIVLTSCLNNVLTALRSFIDASRLLSVHRMW